MGVCVCVCVCALQQQEGLPTHTRREKTEKKKREGQWTQSLRPRVRKERASLCVCGCIEVPLFCPPRTYTVVAPTPPLHMLNEWMPVKKERKGQGECLRERERERERTVQALGVSSRDQWIVRVRRPAETFERFLHVRGQGCGDTAKLARPVLVRQLNLSVV